MSRTSSTQTRSWGLAVVLGLLLTAVLYGLWQVSLRRAAEEHARPARVLGYIQLGEAWYAQLQLPATAAEPAALARLDRPGLRDLRGSRLEVVPDPQSPQQVAPTQPWLAAWQGLLIALAATLLLGVVGSLQAGSRLLGLALCVFFALGAGVLWTWLGQDVAGKWTLLSRGVETDATILGIDPFVDRTTGRRRSRDLRPVLHFLASAADPPRLVQIATDRIVPPNPTVGVRRRVLYLPEDPSRTLLLPYTRALLWLAPAGLGVFALLLTGMALLFVPRRRATTASTA